MTSSVLPVSSLLVMAVKAFLKGDIKYLEIYDMIERAMQHHVKIENPDVAAILATEQETYNYLGV